MLIVLSFPNFRRDRFDIGNFVVAKTLRVYLRVEAKFRQPLLSIRIVQAIDFYIAQLYNYSIAVLNKFRSYERKLVAIEGAAGNATQSQNEQSGKLDASTNTLSTIAFKTKSEL